MRTFGIISKRCFCLCVVKGLSVLQRIGSTQEGKASFTLSGDYYNRELSGELGINKLSIILQCYPFTYAPSEKVLKMWSINFFLHYNLSTIGN